MGEVHGRPGQPLQGQSSRVRIVGVGGGGRRLVEILILLRVDLSVNFTCIY